MNSKKYITTILLTTTLLLLSTATFNLIVDPFGMFRLCNISGFNLYKPDIYTRVRLLKAYEIRRIKPDSIVLGTSRAHLGFNPKYEGWTHNAECPYNLAFDGATTKEMYYFLRHAQAIHPLKQTILSLDTYHPTNAPAATRPDFDPTILKNDQSLFSKIGLWWTDFKILTSFDTLMSSFKTLRAQRSAEQEWFSSNGQRLGEVFFRRPYEDFQKFSPRYYFDEIDQQEVKYKLEWLIPPSHQTKVYFSAPTNKDTLTSLDYIRKIIEFCRQENIDLKILLTPSHAHQMEISAATGEWPSIENGKRALVKILADDAARHPDQQPFSLFDFSGYSVITMETLPEEGTHQEMKYYWDSSHFKDNVGNMVLDRLFNFHAPGHSFPENFGAQLTPENIEQVLIHIRDSQKLYREQNPQDIKIIQALVDDFKRKNNIPDQRN